MGDHGVAARSSDRPSAVVGGRGEAQREGRQTYTQLIHAPEEQRLRQHWEAITLSSFFLFSGGEETNANRALRLSWGWRDAIVHPSNRGHGYNPWLGN